MIEKVNNCCSCDDCLGAGCKYFSSYFVGKCDNCEADEDKFIYFDDTDTVLCFECWKKSLEVIEAECEICGFDEEVYRVLDDVYLCEECLESFWEEHCIYNETYIERRLSQ